MKIILLLNRNEVSADGVYRINRIYDAFKDQHEILIVQCRASYSSTHKRTFLEKLRRVTVRKIPRYVNNVLVSRVKQRIGRIVQRKFGNPSIDERIDYMRIDTDAINSEKVEKALRDHNPDIIIHISSNILRKQIFSIPSIGTLNLHHGVLPDIRGLDAMYWGIYYGRKDWVGATVHFIDDGIDTGEILLKESLDYSEESTVTDVIVSLEKLGTNLLISSIEMLLQKAPMKNMHLENETTDIEPVYRSKASIGVFLVVFAKVTFHRIMRRR